MDTIQVLFFSKNGVEYVNYEQLSASLHKYTRGAFVTCLLYKQIEIYSYCKDNPKLSFLEKRILTSALKQIANEAKCATRYSRIIQLEYMLYLLPSNATRLRRKAFFEVLNKKSTFTDISVAITPNKKAHIRKIDIGYYGFYIPTLEPVFVFAS